MNDQTPTSEVLSPEVVGQQALATLERAQIDVQIATAHAYPRSMDRFKKRALEMVTLDEDTAASCIYRRPVGKKLNEKGQWVEEFAEGKSIRMAEIVGASYGNLRVGSILVELTPRYVKARGVAHDLESNFFAASEVIEATVDRKGNPYSERMRTVVAKACLAKARRDATFQVVPGALCKMLEDAARKTAIGTTATLGARRQKVLDWITKTGIEPRRVWAALGIGGADDIGLEQLETLTGLRTAITDGDLTADAAFPDAAPTTAPAADKPTATLSGALADTPTGPTVAERVADTANKMFGQDAQDDAKASRVLSGPPNAGEKPAEPLPFEDDGNGDVRAEIVQHESRISSHDLKRLRKTHKVGDDLTKLDAAALAAYRDVLVDWQK